MSDNLDKVFLQLWQTPSNAEPTLEWVFKNFDRDKIKLILTPYVGIGGTNVSIFRNISISDYLPRCTDKKFKGEILIPDESGNYEASLMELIIKHGMTKLVTSSYGGIPSAIPKLFDETPNLFCKIWTVDYPDGKLLSTRLFNPEVEVEKFKKIAREETSRREEETGQRKKETSRRESAEKELLSMTNQNKMNEQEIDHLRRENKQLKQENDQLKQNNALNNTFIFKELQEATQNFNQSLKIGKGESGSVYKGTFRGTTVAIKKFNPKSKPDINLLQQEVVILSTVRHPNLVTLIGACFEPPAFVYEFLSRGSLRSYLDHAANTTPLPWQVRTRIIGEVCLALIFLHSNKPNPIIHGDLTPDNILLDSNFTSKLSDFGLIKQGDTDTSNLYRTKTLPYMDPEYLTSDEMTLESDVYSFGVLILHLLTGKSQLKFSKTVKETIQNDKLSTTIDKSAGNWPPNQAKKVAELGVWCAEVQRSNRPNLISEVWPIVEGLVKFPDENM